MGLFKKLGAAVKKGVKQISLKNLVKVGTPFLSMIPIVGGLAQQTVDGLSAANQAKKDAKILAEQGRLEEAALMEQRAQMLAAQAVQPVGQQVGQVAGNTLDAFARGATDEFVASASKTTQKVVGKVGAAGVDFTIKEWFSQHWKLLVGVVVGLGAIIFFWKRSQGQKKPYTKRR